MGSPDETRGETPRRGRALRILRTVAVVLAVLLGIATVSLRAIARHHSFHPSARGDWTHQKARHAIEDVRLDAADGTHLFGWYLHAADTGQARAALLFFHGNGGNVTNQAHTIDVIGDTGLDVLIVDYRGYGKSAGSPDEKGIYLDADAAYRYLTDQRGVPGEKIYLMGVSLGGAPAIDVAIHHPNAGLIIQSSFASIPAMARLMFGVAPPDFLLVNRFDNLARISQVTSPKLFFATSKDETVPLAQTRALYDASTEPRTWVEFADCGHNDLHKKHEGQWQSAIAAFTAPPAQR